MGAMTPMLQTGQRQSSESQKTPIIFVAHSLEGLLCKDTLLLSEKSPEHRLKDIAAHTGAILFAASPHEGSHLAEWVRIPATLFDIIKDSNASLSVLNWDPEVHDRIHFDFMVFLQKRQASGSEIHVTCLFETLEIGLFMVVPRELASLASYTNIPMQADHRDIVRFNTAQDPKYTIVLDELKRWTAYFRLSRLLPQCIKSLAFPEIWKRQSIIARGVKGSCQWVQETEQYKAWKAFQQLNLSHGILWIKGKPGSGKSTVMKDLCETTDVSHLPRNALRLSFFFNKRGAPLEKSLPGLYRSFFLQVLDSKRVADFTSPLLGRFERKMAVSEASEVAWSLVELEEAFHEMIESSDFPQVEIFTDALDECDDDQVRQFIGRLAKSTDKAHIEGRVLNVCWSSRHYPQITVPHCFALRMEDGNVNDITKFVTDRLAVDLCEPDVVKLKNEVVRRARGVFLWASLVLQKLNKASDEGSCRGDLMAVLQSLPEEVDALLREIIASIPSRHRTNCLHLFQWLFCSTTPLPLSAVELAISLGHPSFLRDNSLEVWANEKFGHSQYFFSDSYPGDRVRRLATTISGGLVEVVDPSSTSPFLQFIHQSVPDFLLQESVRETLGISTGLSFREEGLWMMLDAISGFLFSREFDYCLTFTRTEICKASQMMVRNAHNWAETSFGRSIVCIYLEECTDNIFPSLLDQYSQLYSLSGLQKFARCCSKLLLRAISIAAGVYPSAGTTLFKPTIRFMLLAGEQQLEETLECSWNHHQALERLKNPKTSFPAANTAKLSQQSYPLQSSPLMSRVERFCKRYGGPVCTHGIQFLQSSTRAWSEELYPLSSCIIRPEVYDGKRSICVIIREPWEVDWTRWFELPQEAHIPLNSMMIGFKNLKERRTYAQMLLSRFPLEEGSKRTGETPNSI